MTPDAILALLKDFLVTRFDVPAERLAPGTSLRELGLDSMLIMDVLLEIEDRVGHKLVDLALPRDPTLADVTALVQRNLAATP